MRRANFVDRTPRRDLYVAADLRIIEGNSLRLASCDCDRHSITGIAVVVARDAAQNPAS